MKRWILAVLLLAAPAFAASMNTFASQLGGTNLMQLIPGEMPLLTATYAGTSLESANPGVLIFETDIAPIGTFTLPKPSPSAGSSSAFQPPPTRAPPRPDASSRPPLPCPPFCSPRQAD